MCKLHHLFCGRLWFRRIPRLTTAGKLFSDVHWNSCHCVHNLQDTHWAAQHVPVPAASPLPQHSMCDTMTKQQQYNSQPVYPTLPAVFDRTLVPALVIDAEAVMAPGTGLGCPGSLDACTLAAWSVMRFDIASAPMRMPPATC